MVRLSGCSVGFGVVLGPVGKGAKAKGKGGKSQQGKGAKANRDKAKSCTKRQDAWVLRGGGGGDIHGFVGGSWDIHGKVEMDNVMMMMHACREHTTGYQCTGTHGERSSHLPIPCLSHFPDVRSIYVNAHSKRPFPCLGVFWAQHGEQTSSQQVGIFVRQPVLATKSSRLCFIVWDRCPHVSLCNIRGSVP